MDISVCESPRIDKTYKESNVETVAREVNLLWQPLNPGIADVDPVEEGHHVNDEQGWVDAQIQLPQQLLLRYGINGRIVLRLGCARRMRLIGHSGRLFLNN